MLNFVRMCGIFGVYGNERASYLTYLGLYSLQHRGQEGAGITSTDRKSIYSFRSTGLVNDIFNDDVLRNLRGDMAIGHVRYSTTGSSTKQNLQPFNITYKEGGLSLSHNGNLVNYTELRERLEWEGAIFQSESDTEVIAHLIARSKEKTLIDRVVDALSEVEGAYSLLIMTEFELIAVRDPRGFRPLSMGRLGNSVIFASETCAFDIIDAEFIRELEPGEMVVVDEEGVKSLFPFEKKKPAQCVFELIYFSRPDSFVFGDIVYRARREMGVKLAEECPETGDLVFPIPDSGFPAGIGFAARKNLPLELGLIRNHYVGRTFIEPAQSIRNFEVKIKLNPVESVLKGKDVFVVDDSIVRGTTSRKIMEMIRMKGAKRIHLRIASPPITHPCYYGIDTPTRKELIAANHSVEEIRKFLTTDSLVYLSLEGLKSCLKGKEDKFCYACFTGKYPTKTPKSD